MSRTTLTVLPSCLTLLAAGPALAQAPSLLPVSGWLADADGVPLDGDYDVTLAIYDVQEGGAALFEDTVTVQVDAGFFTAYAGENAVLDTALFADHGDLWMGLSIGADPEMVPRAQMATAPWAGWADYAGVADDALSLGGVAAEDFQLAADDSDTLAALGCVDGQIVVFDGALGAWTCQDVAASTEVDPVFSGSDAAGINATAIGHWNAAYGWGDHSTAGYLTSFTETDPIYGLSAAAGISPTDVAAWNSAFGWGNHAAVGYLTSYTETDPVYSASAASGIASGDVANWNTAYGWGNHAAAGYLTSYTETDPVYSASAAASISAGNVTNWNTAYGWGNHASAGYLTSYTEADPVYMASVAHTISASNVTSWNTAYGWGNHAAAGYLTSYTETDPVYSASAAAGISSGSISNWNTAFGWGNHASAGYLNSTAADTAYVNAAGDTMGGALVLNGGATIGGGRLESSGRAWALSASIAYSWDDLTTASLTSPGTIDGDDITSSQALPFPVVIDGTSYGYACITTNGIVHFRTTTGGCSASYSNSSLPTSTFTDPVLFAYWDDLWCEAAATQEVTFGYVGTSPNRVYIVQWDCEKYYNTNYDTDFQVQIHEGSGLLNVRYFNMHPETNGQSATIGFQTAGGTSARAYPVSFDSKVLDDNADDADPGHEGWSIAPIR